MLTGRIVLLQSKDSATRALKGKIIMHLFSRIAIRAYFKKEPLHTEKQEVKNQSNKEREKLKNNEKV